MLLRQRIKEHFFMKILASFLIFSTALVAHASTHFEDTLQMFEAGTALPASSLEAAYAGRCFMHSADGSAISGQDDATGALLMGKVFRSHNDAGPAFPNKDNLIVNLANGANDDSHFRFDNWTESQAMAALNSNNNITSTPVTTDGISQSWNSVYSDSQTNMKFEARAYQKYIVVKQTSNTLSGPDDSGLTIYPGEVIGACYFFKKLQ